MSVVSSLAATNFIIFLCEESASSPANLICDSDVDGTGSGTISLSCAALSRLVIVVFCGTAFKSFSDFNSSERYNKGNTKYGQVENDQLKFLESNTSPGHF